MHQYHHHNNNNNVLQLICSHITTPTPLFSYYVTTIVRELSETVEESKVLLNEVLTELYMKRK